MVIQIKQEIHCLKLLRLQCPWLVPHTLVHLTDVLLSLYPSVWCTVAAP